MRQVLAEPGDLMAEGAAQGALVRWRGTLHRLRPAKAVLFGQPSPPMLPDLIEPVYVARMVVFLASDDAGACTANNFFVEAGST